MAVSGKKINELDAVTTVTNESVLPIVIVSGNNPETTAKKITVQQIINSVPVDVSSVNNKTGAVTLTGNDIKVSASDDTTLDSALSNKQDGFEIITNASSTALIPLPNKIYDFGNTAISTLIITNYTQSYDESIIYFTSSNSGTSITLPSNLSWIGGMPTIESNKKYIISICNGAVISGSY